MKINTLVPVLSIVLATFAVPVLAETISKTVPAGRASKIGGMVLYNSFDCSFLGKPTVTYPKAPEHGTVSVEWTQGRMSDTGGTDRCSGKIVKGMAIIYRPKAGFRGVDKFTIGLRSAFHGTNSHYHAFKYTVTVK